MNQGKFGVIGMLGVVIGILGIVGPIAWDYYKTKSEIELQLIEQSPIVEKTRKLDGLKITYAGEVIDELSRATFQIRNSGRTPIQKKDVISPLYIRLPVTLKTIEAKVLETKPKDLNPSVFLNKGDGLITVEFSLLNPGDTITVGVLTQSADVVFDAGARIAGVPDLIIAPKVTLSTKTTKSIGWTVYAAGIFSLVMTFSGFGILLMARDERKVKNSLKDKSFSLPLMNTREEVKFFITSKFKFTTFSERAPLLQLIDDLPDSAEFSKIHNEAIYRGVEGLLAQSTSNMPVAVFVFTFSALGFWYVIAQIW